MDSVPDRPASLSSSLGAYAAKNPQRAAIFCGDVAMSYEALDESSTSLAHWFVNQGLRPGERVALHWSNSIEAVQLFFALFKAGLIAATVNVGLKPAEIGYILDHSQARMCFSEPALASKAEQVASGCSVFTELPSFDRGEAGCAGLSAVDLDRPAVILYTSGTTTHPKGVTHTHRSLFHTTAINAHELEADEVALLTSSFMNAAALRLVLLPALYKGASAVLLSASTPGAVLSAIERFHCTYMFCLPTLLRFIAEEQLRTPRDVSSIRTVLAGGDRVSVSLQHQFQTLFGIRVREAYGTTEAPLVTLNPKGAIRTGSLGVRKEGVEIRLADYAGRDVADGETGEIVVRSTMNCVGYWNDPEATKAAMAQGWLHTGDLASRDAEDTTGSKAA